MEYRVLGRSGLRVSLCGYRSAEAQYGLYTARSLEWLAADADVVSSGGVTRGERPSLQSRSERRARYSLLKPGNRDIYLVSLRCRWLVCDAPRNECRFP